MSFGIEMLSLEEIVDGDIDLVIDGADQIDLDSGICIKGGGGAHYWEKMVAEKSKKVVIVVDESKIVNDFAGYKIPLEIKEESKEAVAAKLDVVYREGKSDFGNLIADVVYDGSVSILEFEDRLLRIEGVIETGIFASLVDIVIVARNNGEVDVVEIDYT
jgi:ribose 5-phosphate isomerase A